MTKYEVHPLQNITKKPNKQRNNETYKIEKKKTNEKQTNQQTQTKYHRYQNKTRTFRDILGTEYVILCTRSFSVDTKHIINLVS